jgi:DNA-binding IclR family transcriptional regulator
VPVPAPVAATVANRPRPVAHTKSAEIAQIGPLGKPVGAVVAAAKVLRALHASERPLNASEVARAAGLHRGTAYNILRTLQAEGFVSYDEATRTYAVSLQILELAHGVLRRSGLIDIARSLMHAVSDAHGVSVYLSKVLGPSSMLLLDWVGVALRPDPQVTVGRQYPSPAGASGVVIAAFGNSSEAELEAAFSQVDWYDKPSSRFSGAGQRSAAIGFRRRSRRHVTRRHAGVGSGSVVVLGPAADPHGGGTFA